MQVKQHAIRRYRKRTGRKRLSKDKVVRDIQNQIKRHAIRRVYNKDTGQYRVVTPKFVAVCDRNWVITILDPPSNIQEASTPKARS